MAAEARSRVAFGLSLLSAGTPMFFMAEEIGAQKPYRYNDFLNNREDILNNAPFVNGYTVLSEPLRLPNALWKEVFNSDAAIYGGNNVGNAGASIPCSDDRLDVKLPASGFLVFVKQ